MIKCVCPGCGMRADLESFVATAEWIEVVALALTMPDPVGRASLSYLRLFSPPSYSLTAKKAKRVLGELAAAVKAAEVQRKGESRRAPVVLWEQALEEIMARPPEQLPLDNNHYLFSIVFRLAGAAAQRQVQKVEDQRHQETAPRRSETTPVARVMDKARWKDGVAGIRAALKHAESNESS